MATGTLTICIWGRPAQGAWTMAQNLYGPRVRMGNWNEDVYLEEELMRDFLEKRDKGQLLIQRNRRLKDHLLRPMQLSVSQDGYIHSGDKVMLVNLDHPETEADLFLHGDLSLCLTPDEIRAHLSDEFEVPCGLSAAPTEIPVGRNTFIILSADGDATGPVLRYGQNFRLGMTGGFEDKMLYLSSDHRTLLRSSKRSWLQEVYLTDEVSYLNCWQAAFPDPQLRLEYEGFPIPNGNPHTYLCELPTLQPEATPSTRGSGPHDRYSALMGESPPAPQVTVSSEAVEGCSKDTSFLAFLAYRPEWAGRKPSDWDFRVTGTAQGKGRRPVPQVLLAGGYQDGIALRLCRW
ncbi:PREDICTED: cilia- and flagella-associated protein 161 [Hipposideros armiger]|uniref:Cilia- and flagella-associated protein 161 n=1 Tax=Hipposideros armiger TaxID=186990 RepID=A0A8B7R3I8_HIPAR|nr:PREDICTED: cilia- and flagella-associated protein 161 [Hipposideros armiger]